VLNQTSLYYGLTQDPPPYDPVITTSVQFSSDVAAGNSLRVVVLGLAADGSILYRGEDERVISDGVTFQIVCSTVGTP
jgi:hypothetical protein